MTNTLPPTHPEHHSRAHTARLIALQQARSLWQELEAMLHDTRDPDPAPHPPVIDFAFHKRLHDLDARLQAAIRTLHP